LLKEITEEKKKLLCRKSWRNCNCIAFHRALEDRMACRNNVTIFLANTEGRECLRIIVAKEVKK